MSSFPGSPRLVRGGLVLVDPATGAVLRIIALQYNPDTLTRSLQVKGAGAESGDHVEALRLKGPPVETIKVEAEIDATDAMEANDGQTNEAGLHPQLAALETIVYPTSAHLSANNSEAGSGSLEIAPAQAPLPLFVFGAKRIVPVRITELSITEEAFDAHLNPTRAKVSLGLRVLSVDDLGFDVKGGSLFMTYLQGKEQLARRAAGGSFASLGLNGIP
ncbi:hypothetical protein LRH25_10605 [Ideonella azotifigens]|uniref:Uncharacterized protein n=1 Tax=Ideonella azotifigens TaxID=513160 RepID=A0ABP3VN24_9BURK|nr:hypothetical protein [Ideonella azotifigens]MCD2340795.1 hypothetical protein [Ideonella azotifigens]